MYNMISRGFGLLIAGFILLMIDVGVCIMILWEDPITVSGSVKVVTVPEAISVFGEDITQFLSEADIQANQVSTYITNENIPIFRIKDKKFLLSKTLPTKSLQLVVLSEKQYSELKDVSLEQNSIERTAKRHHLNKMILLISGTIGSLLIFVFLITY